MLENLPPFTPWPKIPRWSKRTLVITEKIDGTNASVLITPDGDIVAGSRTRWLSLQQDNFGFARWVQDNATELLKLGPGQHFGEWWGLGIQRGYGLTEKRFSLFNSAKWSIERPACCHVVPVLKISEDKEGKLVESEMAKLEMGGSVAAPGFMQPEGIVIFDTAARTMYKKTFEKDNGKHDES